MESVVLRMLAKEPAARFASTAEVLAALGIETADDAAGTLLASNFSGRAAEVGRLYRALVDVQLNRVRAGVTMAREPDALTKNVIVERLSAAIGKDVIAGFSTDPSILGGVVVRIGDRVYDGSVRKRLGRLRQQLIAG